MLFSGGRVQLVVLQDKEPGEREKQNQPLLPVQM